MTSGRQPSEDRAWLRCDVGHVTDPDLATVDALATVALACRQHGERLLLVGASPALRALIAFAGLERVLWTEEPYAPPDRGSSRSGSPNIGK
jgi:anti-anti-sigma regulatory factor